jgi:hypothetical protein
MFERFDHSFSHPIALGPLWRSALVVYGIVFAHGFKFSTPFTPIVSQDVFRNPISAY